MTDNKELAKEIVQKEDSHKIEIEFLKKEVENQLRFYQITKASNLVTGRVLQDKENYEFATEGDSPMRLQDKHLQAFRTYNASTTTPSKLNTQRRAGLSKTLKTKDQSTKKKYGGKGSPRKRTVSPSKRTKDTLETDQDVGALEEETEKK